MARNLAFAVLFVLVSASLAAQNSTPVYGVDGVSTYVVGAWEMQTVEPETQWAGVFLPNRHRYLTTPGTLIGVAHLPQGAQIVSMELEACDDSDVGVVVAGLTRSPLSGASTLLASVSTGLEQTPGCLMVGTDIPPDTVDNNTFRYTVNTINQTFDGSTTVGAVRIRYRMQVSPAPMQATFLDVPTNDAAFQFIEALAASGITAGCGSGNYCPDAPLTRRQAAVFLARALGLHWPDGPQSSFRR